MDSCLFQSQREIQPHSGFELGLLISFPMIIAIIMLSAHLQHTQVCLYIIDLNVKILVGLEIFSGSKTPLPPRKLNCI